MTLRDLAAGILHSGHVVLIRGICKKLSVLERRGGGALKVRVSNQGAPNHAIALGFTLGPLHSFPLSRCGSKHGPLSVHDT